MTTEIFRQIVDVSDEINVAEPHAYTVSRTDDGKMFLEVSWTKWANSYGHRNLIGSGHEVYVGEAQVRENMHPVLMDAFLDVIEPLPTGANT